MFVTSEKCVRVNVGGIVAVHGGIFTPGCEIHIDGQVIKPMEVSENEICFSAPNVIEETSFFVKNGDVTSDVIRLVIVDDEELQTFKLKDRTSDEFNHHVRGLLPRGFDFSGVYFGKMISVIAHALKYAYGLLKDVIKQSSPYTTEDLDAWEKELGLPRVGLEFVTDDERRKEVIRLSRTRGGMTIPYYRQLLDLYGKEYEIYEYWKNPEKFPSWFYSKYGDSSKFFVLFKIYQTEFAPTFNCKSSCNYSLKSDRDIVLERLLNEYKPAHVQFVFSYSIRILTDESGTYLSDDESENILVG